MDTRDELLARLRPFGQEHLLAFWDVLDQPSRQRLGDQIGRVDFAAIQQFVAGSDGAPDWHELARRAHPPRAIRLHGNNEFSRAAAVRRGTEILRAGQVGMILVAGGQGTRLGFPHPKGLFPLGPVSQRTLFQILADRLKAVAQRHGVTIPLYVMTSPATHDETVAYFESQGHLGLQAEDVGFFCQGMLPAVDRQTGAVLLESHDGLATSPDGHGGMLGALANCGCLADIQHRGLKVIFYGQVDNPLLQICDPALLGYHLLADSEMTTQVVQKRDAFERVGNVVEIDGKTQIIEYSDLPEDAAQRTNPDGSLFFWAGNLAVHVFATSFLARTSQAADALPIHRAFKKVPCLDAEGNLVEPTAPNAIKFERFIFDLLPQARNALVVEATPDEAFAPVKNAPGEATDTAATAQRAMIEHDRKLLQAAGVQCDPNVAVEVNPLWALDVQEAARKIAGARHITQPAYFHEEA